MRMKDMMDMIRRRLVDRGVKGLVMMTNQILHSLHESEQVKKSSIFLLK